MPTINLIYEQRLQKRQRNQRSRMIGVGTAGAAAVVVLICGYFMFEAARYTLQARAIEARGERLKDQIALVDANEAELNQLRPRLTTLEKALEDTMRWDRILGHLSTNTPDGVWLTNIRCNAPDPAKGIMVQFSGQSQSQDAVGSFILRTDASEDIDELNLKFTQERVIEGGKAIEFEIEGELTGTAPPKKVEEKE